MNQASLKRLAQVHPELQKRVNQLIANLALTGGRTIEVVQGLRTAAEQQALFDQGRSKPGHIVTNAKPFQSNHNYGLAVDLCPFSNGTPQWSDEKGFDAIGAEAQKLGLEWGGAWVHINDRPHVQLPGLTVHECYALYTAHGIKGVWDEATRRLTKTQHA